MYRNNHNVRRMNPVVRVLIALSLTFAALYVTPALAADGQWGGLLDSLLRHPGRQ